MKHLDKVLAGMLAVVSITATAVTPVKHQTSLPASGGTKTERGIVTIDRNKPINVSSDRITDRTEREAMRKEWREQSSLSHEKAPAKADEKLYTVKVVFNGEEEYPYMAIYNTEFFEESRMKVWFEGEETDTYYFQVPAGTYDVAVGYYSHVEGMTGSANLVHENIEVNADTETVFSENELTEKGVLTPLLRDGTSCVLPLYKQLDAEPWYEIDYTGANTDFIYLNYILFKEGCEPISSGFSQANIREENFDDNIYLLTNKLSDKYHFVFQYFISDLDGEFQVTTTDHTGYGDGEIYNYIQDFVKYDVPTFAETPIAAELEESKYRTAVQGLLWLDDVQQSGGGLYSEKAHPEVYVASQPCAEGIDIKTPIKVINVQGQKTYTFTKEIDGEIHEWTETAKAEMCGLPALFNGYTWEYINQNHSDCGNFSFQHPLEGPIVEYPGVPAYCYTQSEITRPIGNSSPVLAVMTQVNEYPDATIFGFDPQAYIGRYGEVRNCDQWDLESIVKLDGNIVFDSATDGYLEDWCILNSTDGHAKGIIEASFLNKNVQVDEVKGYNLTTIKVDERNEDLCVPTMQMLIFKDIDGNINDRFAKPEDGIMEFSAGDFNWIDEGDFWGYECADFDLKVEYTPYGEDDFAALEVEEIPENYYMPGFGYFYRGSLESVSKTSTNGWYDLRFTLTDKAGNEMVQRVSPAFYIGDCVGIDSVSGDELKITARNGIITVSGSDISSIELISIDGRTVASTSGSCLDVSAMNGLFIVSVKDITGKKSTCKLTL